MNAHLDAPSGVPFSRAPKQVVTKGANMYRVDAACEPDHERERKSAVRNVTTSMLAVIFTAGIA